MQNRTPVPSAARPAPQDFTPVPRKYRHDGWTPERQKAFIAALADTGSVSRAAAMVNMAQANCYALRVRRGAEAFRRAWEAALDFGVQRLKDIAFERAIEGELIPVFVAGKLMGFRRKRNDALLMFCLRHYGQDAAGRRTTIDYFSARASVEAPDEAGGATAHASATTMRAVIAGDRSDDAGARDTALATTIGSFAGVTLDAEAQAAVTAALEECAARRRAADMAIGRGGDAAADATEDDPDECYVPLPKGGDEYRGALIPPVALDDDAPFVPGEASWTLAGAAIPARFLPAPTEIAALCKTKRKPGCKKRVIPAIAADDPDPVLPKRRRTRPATVPVSRSDR